MFKLKHILTIPILLLSFSLYSQNDCATAVPLSFENYSTCGDMVLENVDLGIASPSSTGPNPGCANFSGSTNDLWYTLVVPTGINTLSFHAFNSSNSVPFPASSNPGMAVYRGTNCSNLTLIDCFESTGGFMQNGEIRWENISGLTPGEILYIRIWDEGNLDQSLFLAASVITDFPEDDCDTPIPLSQGGCNILSTGGDITAPEQCGWNTTDNSIFYSFTVTADDPQPYTITAENGECWSNEGGLGEEPEIQFAVYQWNGTNCNGIGGAGSTYMGCASGTGTVTFSENLPPGNYILAMDGFSMLQGNSLCTYGFGAPFIDEQLVVSLNTTNAMCGEGGTAAIAVAQSCTGNPTYNWSDGLGNTQTVEDIPPGDYSVTVSDGPNCQDTVINFTIADEGDIDVNITTSGDECTGPFSATANVTGANPADCDFEWSTTPTQTTQTATNLAEGDYTVTVTYGSCEETATVTITGGAVGVDITLTGDMCQGPLEATANVTGADIADCTFQWNTVPPQTTQTIIISEPGTYTVNVDADGCTGSDTQNIIFHDLVINLDYEPNLCAGENAYAVVTVIEGQPPYSYSWSTGASSNNININTSGDYSVTVTDGGGCEASEDFAVTIHPSLNLTADVYDISCYGLIDGAVATNTTGGTPPFTYNWNLPYSTDSIGGLPQGTYAVTVTDIHGCSAANNWYVNEPQPLVFSFGMPATICQGDTVPLSIATFGGTEPYTYHWGDDPFLNVDFREVSPDVTTTYTVFVSDANNCSAEEQSVTITVSPPLELNISTTDVNCYNACDGTATLSVIGGSLPLDYSWDANGNYIQNLCADDYSVTVTDNFGCSNSIDFSIAQPDTITIQTLSSPATCFGSPDGMAWLQAWGGTPIDTVNGNFVYNYQWSNGSQNDTIIDTGGVYTVTLTDDNGCVVTSTITIDQPDDIIVTPIGNRQICIGQSSTFSVAATGGNGFFNFEWEGSDGSIYYGDQITVSPDVTTSYTLHVTDGNGCEGGYQTATVNVYPNLEILDVSALEDTVCQGETVRVELDIAGGNGGPYTIHFQDDYVVTTPHIFTPQNSGYFTYTVSDLCGTPTQTDSVFIRVMPMPENSFFVDRTKACPPATFHFTEDSEDIGQNYLWDFGDGGYSVNKNPSHTYTETGRYDVSLTVWSEYGCENKQTILNMITLHPKPRAEFMASPEVMSILNAQVVFTNVTENGGIYFWDFDDGNVTMWTDQDPIHTFTAPGEYDVTLIARNIHECMDTVVKRIKVNDEFSFYAPTAFSPNNDGINDYFYVTGYGIDKYSFNLVIFDRWGNKVFETNVFDPNSPHKMSWDGTDQGSVLKGDILLPIGAYSWYCKFNDIWGNPKERSGVVNIIR
jgi:gliding motility-associated-like protein